MKSGEQLQLGFRAFKENRLPFTVRVKDPDEDTVGRVLFMKEPKVSKVNYNFGNILFKNSKQIISKWYQVAKGEPSQTPICTLNIVLPDNVIPDAGPSEPDLLELEKNYSFLRDGISEYNIHGNFCMYKVTCAVKIYTWEKIVCQHLWNYFSFFSSAYRNSKCNLPFIEKTRFSRPPRNDPQSWHSSFWYFKLIRIWLGCFGWWIRSITFWCKSYQNWVSR